MAPIKQYVNLPGSVDDKTRGQKAILEAVPVSKKKFWQTKREVTWEVAPVGDANVPPKYLATAERARLKEAKTKEADGKFSNSLRLPFVGKDKYKVVCKKAASKPSEQTQLKEVEFETWRKIYYTVWVMNDECERIFGAVKDRFHAAFEPAGIELELVEQLRCKADETYTVMTDDEDETDLPWVYPDDTQPVANAPFHMKIVVLNNLRQAENRDVCVEVDKTKTAGWKQDADRWVEDLDAGTRPASKGKVKLAVVNRPSKLTAEQVRGLKSPRSGTTCQVADAGTLTKGSAVAKDDLIVFAGSRWYPFTSQQKAVADLEKLSPSTGACYELSDGGTLTRGSLTVAAGDKVVWRSKGWAKCQASLGTFRVVDINDPREKPAGVADDVLDALIAPGADDAWELEDAGRLTAGNVDVLKGHLVKWDAGAKKWVIHRGRWEVHIKPGHPLVPTGEAWKGTGAAVYLIEGDSVRNFAYAGVEKVGDEEVNVKAHTDARLNDALDRGLAVKVQPNLGLMVDTCCGYSCGNFVVVRTAEDPGRLESCILQTFTHEIGHSLQQARKRSKLFDPGNGGAAGEEANAIWHTDDKGGQGDHCWHNAKEVDSEETDSGKTFQWDDTRGDLCTLFFRDDAKVEANGAFCPTCAENLRRTNLGAETMQKKGWRWFP